MLLDKTISLIISSMLLILCQPIAECIFAIDGILDFASSNSSPKLSENDL